MVNFSSLVGIAAAASSLLFSFIFVYMVTLFAVVFPPNGDTSRYESAITANSVLMAMGLAAAFAAVFSFVGEQIVSIIMHMLQTDAVGPSHPKTVCMKPPIAKYRPQDTPTGTMPKSRTRDEEVPLFFEFTNLP